MFDRQRQLELREAFNDCIERLATGATVADCLRAYPQYARELAPMLEAGLLTRRAQVTPAEIAEAQQRVRFRFEQAIRQPIDERRASGSWGRLASIAVVFVLLFGIVGGGIGALAQDALPGESLYGVKRFTEDVRLLVTLDDDALSTQFAERRIDETRQLLQLRREEQVTFVGEIEAMTDSQLIVAGVTIQVDPSLMAGQALEVGATVEISATTIEDGTVIATSVRLLRRAAQNVPLTPTATRPAASVTATPMPTRNISPTTTPSPTATQTLTRTPTATITPTVTRPACVISPPRGWERYRIQAGDTLAALAQRVGVSVNEIARVNCIDNTSVIVVGEVIFLPPLPTPTPMRQITATPGRNEQDQRPPPTPTEGRNNNGGGRNG